MSEINLDLLKKTYVHISKNPEEWNQGTWRCGTGMCFAGWAVTLAGRLWVTSDVNSPAAYYIVDPNGEYVFNKETDRVERDPVARAERVIREWVNTGEPLDTYWRNILAEHMESVKRYLEKVGRNPDNFVRCSLVREVARDELGLTENQADNLFHADNTLRGIRDKLGSLFLDADSE